MLKKYPDQGSSCHSFNECLSFLGYQMTTRTDGFWTITDNEGEYLICFSNILNVYCGDVLFSGNTICGNHANERMPWCQLLTTKCRLVSVFSDKSWRNWSNYG